MDKAAPGSAARAFAGALQDPDENVRYYSAWALGRIGSDAPDTYTAVAAAVKDKNPDVRRKAVWALPRLQGNPEKSVPLLIGAFTDRDIDVREQAADSVASFGKDAVPPLLEKLKDPNKEQHAWPSAPSVRSVPPPWTRSRYCGPSFSIPRAASRMSPPTPWQKWVSPRFPSSWKR